MGTTGLSITLANSIIGVGILAMPFCFQQCGVLLASLILLSMGLVSRLCCYFLLKSALLARRRNFEFLAFHVFGPAGKLAVEIGIIGFLMGTCIAYFVVVGDLGPQIISKMFNINQSDVLRTSIMVIVSLVCVLPLGLLRNVDSLSNVSAATIGFYFCLVIKVIAEAATQLPSVEWHNMEMWKPSGVLQCVPIFSMALFCQTQLFEIFESLPSLSLEKMNVVTKNAINICTSVYFTLGLFGVLAFSSREISGNILMSLSPTMANDVIKLGFVMSLAFSFPLIIFPCRASLYSLLYKKVHSSQHDHIINHSIPETTFRCITVGIIAVTLFISLLIPNIELVLGLVGSTIGVLICVVFPAACFINVTFKNTNERVLAKGVLVLGLIIMVLGTFANLEAAESTRDKYDDRFITPERIDQIVEDFFQKRHQFDDQHLKPINVDSQKVGSPISKDNIMKDSEVQPPIPVPPDSNSNELKSPETKTDIKNNNNEVNKNNEDLLIPEKLKEEAADKVSETHPKNLNKVIEPKQSNGDAKIEEKPKEKSPSNEEIKNEKLNIMKQQQLIETMKQHGEEQKELMKEQKEILDQMIKDKQEANGEKIKQESVQKLAIDDKQKQLIETIKQHGQEQKQLMKEQKEILNEIIKTKKELQQNKEQENDEAKKKAVESIKQIADIAIKSIGGATEKPSGQKEEVKKLEQLTNEAVQEIAKKAAETIEAIQEINENPESKPEAKLPILQQVVNNIPAQPVQMQNLPQNTNVKRDLQQNAVPNNIAQPIENKPVSNIPQNNAQPINNVVPQIQNNPAVAQALSNAVGQNPSIVVAQNPEIQAQPVNNVVPQNAAAPQPVSNVDTQNQNNPVKSQPLSNVAPQNQPIANNVAQTQHVPANAQPINNAAVQNQAQAQPVQNTVAQNQAQAKAVQNTVAQNQVQAQSINNVAQNEDTKVNPVVKVPENKPHSHSPDEPQSYIVGEDIEVKQVQKLNQNLPLPLAMNGLKDKQETLAKKPEQNIQPNNPEIIQRQKREVVDCTKTMLLAAADRKICETLLPKIDNSQHIPPKIDKSQHILPKIDKSQGILPRIDKSQDILPKIDKSQEILPKVDLNDNLMRLPIDPNLLHIGRSLKSYDKKKR